MPNRPNRPLARSVLAAALAFAAIALAPPAAAQRFGRLRGLSDLADGADDTPSTGTPAGTRAIRDVAYGPDKAQRFDVYLPAATPADAAPAPVVFFVHGGGWRIGDKAMRRMVDPKVGHWVARGWVVISTNYRLLPTPVVDQAADVAAAVAFAQSQAGAWHADPGRFVLMGHSAGAHLVALLAAGATPGDARPRPWRGAVLLDSAALDVPRIMAHRHLHLYDAAFGADPAQWAAVSPMAQLRAGTAPMLAVCSSRRQDSCPQADDFTARVRAFGGQARVLREDLSHAEINKDLGAPSDYTAQVDAFLDGLR